MGLNWFQRFVSREREHVMNSMLYCGWFITNWVLVCAVFALHKSDIYAGFENLVVLLFFIVLFDFSIYLLLHIQSEVLLTFAVVSLLQLKFLESNIISTSAFFMGSYLFVVVVYGALEEILIWRKKKHGQHT